MVYQWKDEFLSNASKVFESDRATRQQEKQIDNLHRKTGELELDFAKRALKATLYAPPFFPHDFVLKKLQNCKSD